MKSKFLSPVICLLLAQLLPAAVLSTIATTGYNLDIVVESGLSPTSTGFVNGSIGSRAFFQNGAFGPTAGLQQSNTLTFGGDTVNFNFQPFSGNNALNVGSTNSTLTVSSPAAYSTIGIVSTTSVANGTTATINYTINYATGAATTGSFTNSNWNASEVEIGSSDPLLTIAGRAAALPVAPSMSNGTPQATTEFQNVVNEGQSWRIFLYEIPVDPSREITSVSVNNSTINSDTKLFGIVGAAVPEPSSALLGAAAMGFGLMLRRRK